VVPPSVTEVQERAIYECDNLKSVDLGGSVTVIENSLCARCYALETIKGLESVSHLEPFALMSTALREVRFETAVTNIGEWAFYDCTNLTAVYFEGDAPETVDQGVYFQSDEVTTYYRSGSSGFGETWPAGPYARPTAIYGPLPASSMNLFGETVEPDARGVLQIPAVMEVVFTGGDRLFGDGTNLYYVTADGGTTNALTANP
jgi:hypothetical protein